MQQNDLQFDGKLGGCGITSLADADRQQIVVEYCELNVHTKGGGHLSTPVDPGLQLAGEEDP